MKTRIFLICVALSTTAWGAEPAAETAAPANSANPPAAQTAQPAEQKAAPAAETDQKAAAAADQSGFSRGSVVRSVFTSSVKDREPVDKLNDSKTSDDHIYYYTELRDMSGQTAVHRWQYKGKVVAEVKFKVRGPRWRVWSSKSIPASDTGEWKVSVLNGAGEVIAEDMIDYTGQADQKPAADEKPATTQQPADQQAPAQQPAADDNMSK